MSNILAEKAVLANLSIRAWSARRFDAKATKEVAHMHAAKNAGRFNKQLVAKESLADIQRIAVDARIFHYAHTLPWQDDGSRVLPSALFTKYAAYMQDARQRYESKIADFCAEYPAFVADAEVQLNGLFNAADYPSVAAIRGKFAFETRIVPCPTADDFRVDLSAEQKQALQAELATRLHDTLRAAQIDVCERMVECIGHMADKLAAFKPAEKRGDRAEGIFRDSLVENVRELAALLPGLNVTGDATLAKLADRMQDALCRYDADDLREDDNVRARVAKNASAILADVREFMM